VALFETRNVDAIKNAEAAVEALADERLRAEFTVKLKQFLATLDLVLPRPEALPFVRERRVAGRGLRTRPKPVSRGAPPTRQGDRP